MLTETKLKQAKSFLFGTIALSIFLFPLFYVMKGVFPVYDDYWFANVVSENGFGGAQLWWREHATGRYISTWLNSIAYYSIHNLFIHRLLLTLILLFFIVSVYKFFQKFCLHFFNMNTLSIFLVSLFVITFYYTNLVGFSEFVFWLPGASTYALSAALLGVFTAVLFFQKPQKPVQRFLYLCLTGFFICGTSEIGSISALGSFVFYFFLPLSTNRLQVKRLLISAEFLSFLVVSIFFFFLVFGAPGNALRMESEKSVNNMAGDFLFALKYSGINLLRFLYNYFYVRQGWLLFVVAVIITLLYCEPLNHSSFSSKRFIRNYIGSQLIILMLSVFLFFTYHFSTGLNVMIPRALSLIQFLWCLNIVISGMMVCYYLSYKLPDFNKTLFKNTGPISITALALLLVMSSGNGNIAVLYKEIRSGIIACDQQYFQAQYNAFKNCKIDDVKAKAPSCKSITYVWDLSDEKFNTRYFAYYESLLCKTSTVKP